MICFIEYLNSLSIHLVLLVTLYVFCCVFTMFNIGFWNVHGLNEHKSEDEDFLSYVNRYDIVGFAKTLNDIPRNLPNFPLL